MQKMQKNEEMTVVIINGNSSSALSVILILVLHWNAQSNFEKENYFNNLYYVKKRIKCLHKFVYIAYHFMLDNILIIYKVDKILTKLFPSLSSPDLFKFANMIFGLFFQVDIYTTYKRKDP